MKTIRLNFHTALAAPPQEVWAWATSIDGIAAEMFPLLRMRFPAGTSALFDDRFSPGRRLHRSWLLLFGLLPVDRSDLTFLELEPGRRFLEQSPMLSMKLWRHERIVEPAPGGAVLADRLEFAPRVGAPLVRFFVKWFFERRHAALRRRFGAT
jgi:ligand-binding SRPBCC domain-containing protein